MARQVPAGEDAGASRKGASAVDIEAVTPRSRRAILAAAGGGLAALAAEAFAGASPAQAANGDVVHVGQTLAGTTATHITNSSLAGPAIWGTGTGAGVAGNSPSGHGVAGESTSGTGVLGLSSSQNGVRGVSGTGHGVHGEATTTGVGVAAAAPLTGVALHASGKVVFTRSGKATMAAGTSTKTVALAGVTTGSLIFAILGSNATGRWVRAVVPAAGSFTIYLNTTVIALTPVSWFVLN
jgi:hypothetical protein